MDIRNVYESSQVDQVDAGKIEQLATAMSVARIKRFLLYKRFLRTLISDIQAELRTQVEQSFLSRLKERLMGTADEVFTGLDAIIARIDEPVYENIDGFLTVAKTIKRSEKRAGKASANLEASASVLKADVGASLKSGIEATHEENGALEESHVELLMRIVGVNEIISELRKVLKALDIRYLYIFLDDFSELPEEPMRLLVDSLISPLTRWSDFIKFKVAAYPGRVYLGSLDKTKVEEFYLDMYGLYGASGVTNMEEKATDFVKRVIERRLAVFCKAVPEVFFSNTRSGESYFTQQWQIRAFSAT